MPAFVCVVSVRACMAALGVETLQGAGVGSGSGDAHRDEKEVCNIDGFCSQPHQDQLINALLILVQAFNSRLHDSL